MLLTVFAASTVGAAPICEELPARTAQLADAKDDAARLDALIAAFGGELGVGALGDGLPKDASERAAAAGVRLERACAAWNAPRGYAGADHEKLAEILARSEFAAADESENVWVQRALRWLRQALAWLFATRGAETFAEGTRFIVLAIAVAVVLYAAVRLVRALRRRGVRPAAGGASATAPLLLDDPEQHLRRARDAVATAPREAIREGLLSLLSALERKRLARPDRVKTNRELAAELPRRGAPPDLHAAAERLLRWYDGAFYSLQPVRADEARRFLDGVVEVQAVLQGTPAR